MKKRLEKFCFAARLGCFRYLFLMVAAIVIAVAANVQAHPKQIVCLNHVPAVVDSETVSAIEQSSNLRG